MMKTVILAGLLVATAACASSVVQEPITGEYAINECNSSEGTLSLSVDKYRLTETVCDIAERRRPPRRSSAGRVEELRLTNCVAEGMPVPDRGVLVGTRVDGGVSLILSDPNNGGISTVDTKPCPQ